MWPHHIFTRHLSGRRFLFLSTSAWRFLLLRVGDVAHQKKGGRDQYETLLSCEVSSTLPLWNGFSRVLTADQEKGCVSPAAAWSARHYSLEYYEDGYPSLSRPQVSVAGGGRVI